MVLHLPHAEGGFGVTCNNITKDAAFYIILLLHVLWLGLVLSPRSVRACGCPTMIFRTPPHGHRPRSYSSATSTMGFWPTTIARTVHERDRLGRSSQDGDSQQQQAGPLLLPQLNFPTCPPSPRSTGSPSKSSSTGSRFMSRNICLWYRVVPSSSAFARSSALSLRQRTPSLPLKLRWGT